MCGRDYSEEDQEYGRQMAKEELRPIINALVAALEAASGHISEHAPHEIERQIDAALALARKGG